MLSAILLILDTILRAILMYLDWGIYKIAGLLYDAIYTISRINVFSGDIGGVNIVNMIGNNIYAFLGIFMLFRLAVAFVQYIMDPDKLTDAKQGGSKIIVRCLMVILFIVLTPIAFRQAMRLQTILIEENVMQKLVFGKQTENIQASTGDALVSSLYAKVALLPGKNCDTEGNSITYVGGNDLVEDYYNSINSGESMALDVIMQNQLPIAKDDAATNSFNYLPLFTIVFGAFLAYVLFITCIDVALRSVKLAFYEMIAPIPIMSYLIPGQDGMLSKWAKECLKTYLSLFITLTGFFFGMLLILYMTQNFDTIWSMSGHHPFIFVFIILGILLFIKNIPNILKGIGIDVGDGMGLSLGKRLAPASFLGGALAGAFGGATASIIAQKEKTGNGWKAVRSGFGGFFSGAATGMYSGLTNKDGKNVASNAFKSTAAHVQGIKSNTNAFNRWVDQAGNNLGIDSDNSRRKAKIKMEQDQKLYDAGEKMFKKYGEMQKELNLSDGEFAEWKKKHPDKKFMAEQWKEKYKGNERYEKYADTFIRQFEANEELKLANNALVAANTSGDSELIGKATKRVKAAEGQANELNSQLETMNATGGFTALADDVAAFEKYDKSTKFDRSDYNPANKKNNNGTN